MRIDDLPEFLTVEEVASVLRIGRTSAYAQVRRFLATGGEEGLACVRVGRTVRVSKATIVDLYRLPTDGPRGG